MWQSTARKILFELKDGLKVVCQGQDQRLRTPR